MAERPPYDRDPPPSTYLESRLIELSQEWSKDPEQTVVGNLQAYFTKCKATPGFGPMWEGFMAHGTIACKRSGPFDINAFLCGTLTGLKTVEAAETPAFTAGMLAYLKGICLPLYDVLHPVKARTTAEADWGWQEIERTFPQSPVLSTVLTRVLDEFSLTGNDEVDQFKTGMGLVIAGHHAAFPQIQDTPGITDAELKSLLSSDGPSEE